MRVLPSRFPVFLVFGIPLLAASGAAAQADVTYAARVDRKNEVYVDVENSTRSGIRMTSVVVAFYDKRRSLIEKLSLIHI